jgi:hypothetical protein
MRRVAWTLQQSATMADTSDRETAQSRAIAAQARQKGWQGESFLKELFLGNMRPDLLLAADDPAEPPPRAEFVEFYERLHNFLRTQVNPAAIDESGEYPAHVLEGLARLGAFGI